MDKLFVRNRRLRRTLTNILSMLVILAMAFPATSTASAEEANPRMVVSITGDWFRVEQFSPAATLNVKIYNQLGGNLLWEADRTTDDTGYAFVGAWEFPVDLKPGNYLEISDAFTTKTIVLEAVTLDVVDALTDYLAGTASAAPGGRLVWVGTGNANYGCSMDVVADPVSGAWTADFNTQPCDVTEDMWAAAQVFDEDGDASEGNLPGIPFFTVFPEWEAVEGWDWTQDATVHLEIDDPATPQSPDHSQDADVVPTPWNPNDVWVRFDFAGVYDVKPGDIVTLSEGATSLTYTVRNLAVTGTDKDADTVTGTADAGTDVHVWPHGFDEVLATTGDNSVWVANFNTIGMDLLPGMSGRSEIRDEARNATAVDWHIPNPHIVVFPAGQWFEGLEWPDGATVNIQVEGKSACDTSKESWGGYFSGNFAQGCEVVAGDKVTFDDGATSRTHIVQNLTITEVDKDANTLAGTADSGATVYASVWGFVDTQVLVEDGMWSIDFDTLNVDLVEGMSGRTAIRDEFGNETAVDWHIPKPRMVIFPEWEWFDGLDWPDGSVTITVEDKPECNTTRESLNYFFNGPFGEGCDIVVGDVVTFSSGEITRTHKVRNLAVTDVIDETNIIAGTADEGAKVYVWPHKTGQQLQAIANDAGNWQVDFTGQFDLVPGEEGRSQVLDEFENATAVDWRVPWPPATYTVNTTDDNDDGTCDETHCSLREAINVANARPVADTIVFNIPGDPPFTIQPQSAYPDLTDPVTIDGTTQPGFDQSPIIELDGTYAGDGANGFVIPSSDSTIKGLVINRFSGNGILVYGSGNTVQGNYIGTDMTGTTSTGPSGPDVGEYTLTVVDACPAFDAGTNIDGFVSQSDDPLSPWSGQSVHFRGTESGCSGRETIGASSLIYRYKLEFPENTQLTTVMISGAAFNGPDNILRVLNENMQVIKTAYTYGGNSFQTPFVTLQGVEGTVFYIDEFDTSTWWRFRQNIVINGPAPLGNYGSGVALVGGATKNLVLKNLISGNFQNGVAVFNPGTTDNVVQENSIGTDVTGMLAVGNAAPGVGMGDQAYNNFIIGNLIAGNKSDGVAIGNSGTNGNTLQGNTIGTDASGMNALPNEGVGIWIGDGASDTVIGGTDASVRNVISGNKWGGVSINDLAATGTRVSGNYIGTDKNGAAPLPNGGDGVYISGSQSIIGGTDPGAGNLISANRGSGVGIRSGTQNTVLGNYMGTDATGTTTMGPSGPAVGDYTVTQMEGSCPAYPAETDFDGFVSQSDDPLAPWSGVSVTFVGTDECGSPERIGEASLIYRYKLEFAEDIELVSILVKGAAFNGPDSILRVLDENMNVLGTTYTYGGNSLRTPFVALQGVTGRVFYVDEFDTSSTWRFRETFVINGPLPLGNIGDGVSVGDAPDNTIDHNVISGNQFSGIAMWGGSTTGNVIRGNLIGTNSDGTNSLPNSDGVWLGDTASNNVIGGVTDDARNIISGNNIFGVSINNPETMGNVVRGNYIGTDVTGTSSIPNAYGGLILTLGTSQNQVNENLISGNNGDGVTIVDVETSDNVLQGNLIGTDATGTLALGNQYRGIFIAGGAHGNLIGGTETGTGNLISANGAAGIRLADYGTTGNQIQGNLIGTDITGMNPLGNGYVGIRITDGAANNVIGGNVPGSGNIIAFNAASGVALSGEDVFGNALLSNSMFLNGGLGIDLAEDDVTLNDLFDPDAGPNHLQNFPIFTSVTAKGTTLKIHGQLISTPSTTYRLEFFSNDSCDPSGYGEGKVFLGIVMVTTNPDGVASFKISLPVSIPVGAFITATATDPDGNTSEFSQCFGPVK